MPSWKPSPTGRAVVDATRAPNIVRAYASDWRDSLNFRDARGLEALPGLP